MKLSTVGSFCNSLYYSNNSNHPKNQSFSFKSRVVYEDSKERLTSFQKDYIDNFEEGRTSDTKFLGEGVTARAYYSPICDFVIKQGKYSPYVPRKDRGEMGSLAYENEMLLSIDPHVKTTQRGIAYVETAKGGEFLLSTFVKGKPANKDTNPFTEKHIDRLLRNLYRLDKSFIIHSDLSRPNLLLDDEENVNIIDYQYADTYDLAAQYDNYSLENSFFPEFETPNNATLFESAGLAGYSQTLPNDKRTDFLKNYYSNKVHYLRKNVERIEKYTTKYFNYSLLDAVEFEKSRAKAYEHIDTDILSAELLKMNILNLQRRQYTCFDQNVIEPRNILRTIPLTIRAKECANELSFFNKGSYTDKNYFKYMRDFGKYWQENMENWYTGTLKWIYEMMTGEEKPKGRIFFPEKFNDFSHLDIVETPASYKVPRRYAQDEAFLIKAFKKAYNNRNHYNSDKYKVFDTIERIFKVRI